MPLTLQDAFNLALRQHQIGQWQQAENIYQQILAQFPNHTDTLHMFGLLTYQRGQPAAAITLIRKAIALDPQCYQAYSNLGIALLANGQVDEAIAACRQAITLRPDSPEAYNNLGNPLEAEGKIEEAIAAYQKAIALQHDYPQAHLNLGNALKAKGCVDEAMIAYRHAISLAPAYAEAHANLANVLKDTGQLDEAIATYRRAMEINPAHAMIHSSLLYTLHFHPDSTPASLAAAHRAWNERHALPLQQFIQPHPNDRSPQRRLRIGYISPDFGRHPVGRFLLPLFAAHDHQQFEIFAYSDVYFPDDLTRDLERSVDRWKDIIRLTPDEIYQLIRADQIDILVDLSMHMARNSLLIFARKPAPVQVTYLAYCSTTGLPTIDYRFSDPYLEPPGIDAVAYSEKTILLPQTYWCYQPSATLPVAPLPALTTGYITFGCLNTFGKITTATLQTWARLLAAVPNSHLLLHAHEGFHRRRTIDFLESLGVSPDRIRFVGKSSFEDYLHLYDQIDIALDPFPYCGGTTSCDALYMGVPLITLAGNTAVGRGGASILTNLNLKEFIAHTPEDYTRLASTLAADLPRLSTLRSELRQRMQNSPLMNVPLFAQAVETLYRQLWTQHCAT